MNKYVKINIILAILTGLCLILCVLLVMTIGTAGVNISTGIRVYEEASKSVQNSDMNKESVQVINQQYTMYEGKISSGGNIKMLINTVKQSNDDVSFIYNNKEYNKSKLSNLESLIKSKNKYSAECQYDEESGLVNKIVIKDEE